MSVIAHRLSSSYEMDLGDSHTSTLPVQSAGVHGESGIIPEEQDEVWLREKPIPPQKQRHILIPIVPPAPPFRSDSHKKHDIPGSCSSRQKVRPVSANTTLKQRSFISPSVLFLDDPGFRNVHKAKGKRGAGERVVELLEDSCDIDSTCVEDEDMVHRPNSLYDKPSEDTALPSASQQHDVQSSVCSNTEDNVSCDKRCKVNRVSPPTYHDVMQKQGVYDVTV
jgi:hypothetical protein